MPNILKKLMGKKKKLKTGEKLHEEYESEDVAGKQYTNQRAAPELVLADAPKGPRFGGKGLQSNTTYQMSEEEEADTGQAESETRTAAGKGALGEFGQPPKNKVEYEAEDSPAVDSHGQPAARAAMDGVTSAEKPGENIAIGHQKGGPELGSGNAPIGDSEPDPVVPALGDRPGVVVNALVLLKIALCAYLVFLTLFTAWLRPSFYALFWSILLGTGLGFAYSWLFYSTRYTKKMLNDGFNIQPGRKGMLELLGQVPSWITFQEKERVVWANMMMGQMWQYYDKAIGEAIKESVEPIMDQYKPPGLVNRIFFKRITFGDLPIQIDDIWVENEGEKHILLEMSFRLSGNSNIEIAVEIAGGSRLVPKVTDLHVSGVARVILSPLLPEIPGFGAMVFSLKRPPLIHFNLNFGSALGGGASAGLIKMWLDPFLRDTLTSLLVWPNRIVFPILPESPANNLEELSVRNVGLMSVKVIEADDLDKEDFLGKSDPLVEIWTQQSAVETTHHKKKTLHPTWNEHFHLLVQEPKTQAVRVQVYDWDGIHLKEVFSTINLIKGVKESFGAKTFMARTAIDVRPFSDQPGKPIDKWYDLGKNDWSYEEGTGKGHGKIRIQGTYWPFQMIYSKPRNATMGAVLIHLKEAKDLPAADSNGLSDPYAVLKLGKESKKSMIQYDTLSPAWNEKFEFVKVLKEEILTVEIWDDDPLDPDDELGIVEIDIAKQVAEAPQCTIEKIFVLKEVPKDTKTKEQKRSTVTIKVQWVPFDFDEQDQ